MAQTAQTGDWIERFPGLSRLGTGIRRRLAENSRVIEMPRDTVLFGPGNSPEHMLFLLDGTVRVQQVSDTGREIVLYRINAGESCVLTTACLLAYDDYSAEGIAETDMRAAAVPRGVFDDLVAQSPDFRAFVFAAFSKRITDLFLVIDEVAFQRMDVRLAQRLLALSGEDDTVATTHQKLAVELGTAREVISRQLQEFQRRGWIAQSRGTVRILEREKLVALAT
ncbi:helix-turn-helix domain-containing protein [Roseovarius salis]|uniref:Crp/Fnr family transcriptional regulator n=1 Tax=Roseovarius salis TaxID=3376063 RepID=UPI0037C8BC97